MFFASANVKQAISIFFFFVFLTTDFFSCVFYSRNRFIRWLHRLMINFKEFISFLSVFWKKLKTRARVARPVESELVKCPSRFQFDSKQRMIHHLNDNFRPIWSTLSKTRGTPLQICITILSIDSNRPIKNSNAP